MLACGLELRFAYAVTGAAAVVAGAVALSIALAWRERLQSDSWTTLLLESLFRVLQLTVVVGLAPYLLVGRRLEETDAFIIAVGVAVVGFRALVLGDAPEVPV